MFSVCSSSFISAQLDSPLLAIFDAQSKIENCFKAVQRAELAGANITDLLTQLNEACDLVAQAENAYRLGDVNLSLIKAGAAVPIAEKVSSEAKIAESGALINSNSRFWFAVAFLFVGLVVYVSVLFFVWRRFKRNYVKKLLGLKPEVVENEP